MGNLELTSASFQGQSLLYYSEEWIEGESLWTILQATKLSVAETLKLCVDITQGISELWSLNKIHRDIKPQNIMRQQSDGTYVLLDLGLALDLEDKSLTQYGYVPGTKTYFSPEQLDILHKRDIDFRSDLFSLGIVLYISLTGKHPFYEYGISDQELFKRIMSLQLIVEKNNLYFLSINDNSQKDSIWAFELKLSNWKRALFQALQYKAFANYVAVVLPYERENILRKNLSAFITLNVGVLLFDPKGQKSKWLRRPKKEASISKWQTLFLLGKISNQHSQENRIPCLESNLGPTNR